MSRHRIQVVCALAALVARSATAAPPPTSLNNCQNAVKKATKAFVTDKVMSIGTCLQAVSTQIVQNNAPDAHVAAGTCVTQFRRINDSRGLDKQLSDKLATAVIKKCAPGQPNVTHTLADIIGAGAGVSQPLNAANLNRWCSHYGGDGSIDSLQEWIACVTAAAECDVDSTIASQYPRALEWLNLVKPSMQTLSAPVADPTKVTDAVAGLDVVKAEIDGPDKDDVVSIQCGGIGSTGTATAADVLTGKTFSNSSGGGLAGTMPNNGAVTLTPGTSDQTIAPGYHNGSGKCAGDPDLVAGNIKTGVNLFGVDGDSNVVNTSSGDAAAGDLLSGKIAWIDGAQVTGIMSNNGAVTLTPSTTDQTIALGFHNGSGKCVGDPDLLSGNIKSGVNLFGINGSSTVVDTSGATATAADMINGKTAYANGSLVTGSATAGSNVSGANGLKTFNIPDGLYASSKTATANDTNLVAGNIKKGLNIFGVTGTAPPPPMATGETTSYAAGDDGALQKGASRSYTDNGDGTITDNTTGLMWEKKVKRDGVTDGTNLHDADNAYPWGGNCTSQTACNSGGTCCQSSVDCVTPHTCTITDGQATGKTIFQWVAQLNTANFAGHNDWRAPNVNELQSIVNYQVVNPSVSAAFHGASCGGACTDITSAACSCTQSYSYWSSSTFTAGPYAWIVDFNFGGVLGDTKSNSDYVRAVRGGS